MENLILLKGGMRKMRNRYMLSVFAIAVVALLGIGMVSAYRGNPSVTGPNFDEERHEALLDIFENLDYSGWIELMTEGGRHPRIIDVINEDNFATFVELREVRIAGDDERISELVSELGLNNGVGPRDGTGFRLGNGKGIGRGPLQGEGVNQGNNERQRPRDCSCLQDE